MPTVAHVAKQVVRGLPYLKKELGRQWSLKTGTVMTTPTTYYVIFSGRCNLACTFCTIYIICENANITEDCFIAFKSIIYREKILF